MMTTPITIDDDQWLCCPRCGENYVHHMGLSIFNRTEDSSKTRVTHLGTAMDSFATDEFNDTLTSAEVDSAVCDNPSPRRHGLQIFFYCETCGADSALNIYQHKGFTGLEWRD